MAQQSGDTPPAASRALCIERRDQYYACLAAAHAIDAAVAKERCAELRGAYVGACPRSWVRYWEDRHVRKLPMRHVTGEDLSKQS